MLPSLSRAGSSPSAGGAVGVVVLGMGRSGTSAVTGTFASAGFFVAGEQDLMGASESNPVGHWESWRLVRINEEILERLHGSWFDPPSEERQLAAREWAVPALRQELEEIVAESGGLPVAIKDPRIGVLTPLWSTLIEDRFHPVLAVRHPIEIAQSLQRRDGTMTVLSLAAWELHTRRVLEFLHGRMVTVAPYARLLEDPVVARRVLEDAVGHLAPERCTGVDGGRAPAALVGTLRRNRATTGDHGLLTARQRKLWSWLAELPAGDHCLRVPAGLRRAGSRWRRRDARPRHARGCRPSAA